MTATRQLSGTDWLASVQSLMTTVVIAVFVITFVVQAFQIPSESMENTLLIGDYLLVDKLTYGGGTFWDRLIPYRQVRRGDIVVFHYPVSPAQHFVKRVVGVPGDRVRLIKGQVFVNGIALTEPYIRHSSSVPDVYRDDFPQPIYVPGETASWVMQMEKWVEDKQLIIPEDSYFVLGDNRDESLDSRYWGFVPRENIIGRPLMIYWSVRSINDGIAANSKPDDKLYHFAYVISHLVQITRWDRTFRLIR
jgi:signal peptidase I